MSINRTLISATLILTATIWIFLTIWHNIGQIISSFASLELGYVAVSFIPAIIAVFITAYVYFLILSKITTGLPPVQDVMTAFLTSQVVRYLPGKIWGVYYQMHALSGLTPMRHTLKAAIEHYLLVNLNSIAVALSVLTYYRKGVAAGVEVFIISVIVIFLILRISLLQRVSSEIGRLTATDNEPFAQNRNDARIEMRILGLLQAEWICYFMACIFILPGYFGVNNAIIIATSYAVAWLIGALAVVLPAGLFVREASFIWITGLFGFNPADMLIFGIVARTLFTLAEIISAALSMLLMRTDDGLEAHEG